MIPLIIIALLAIAGGTYVAMKKSGTSETASQATQVTTTDNGAMVQTTTEARIEFPWAQYESTVNARASSNNTKLIGQTVNLGVSGKATLLVAGTANLGATSNVTSAYVFNNLNLGANGKIGKLYVEESTSILIGLNATVGEKIVLSHNELVRQAEAEAGMTVQTSATTNTSGNTTTNVNATVQTNTSTQVTPPATTVTTANFAGTWNGTYTSSSLAGTACKSSGPVSLSVNSSGNVIGSATINGVQAPGTGKVDGSGSLSGNWNYTGTNLNYTGKLNSSTNTGSGSYQNALGCFGTFSVSK